MLDFGGCNDLARGLLGSFDIMAYHIEVIEAKRWRNNRTGQLVSTGGSCPWHSDAEKLEWSLQVVGFTWYDRKANTTGLGRQPVATREEAQAIADTINGLKG